MVAVTLVEVGLEVEGLELVPGVRWDFLSVQWPSLPCQGWGLIPSCWAETLRIRLELTLFT